MAVLSLKKMLWPLSQAKLPINIWWIQSQMWSFLGNKPTTVLLSFPCKITLKSFWPRIHFNLQHLQGTTVLKSKMPHCEWKKNYLWVFRRYSQTPLCSHCHSNVFYATQRSLHQRDHLVLLDASYYTLKHYRVYHHSKQIDFHCVDHWAQSSNADPKAICYKRSSFVIGLQC